MPPVVTMCIGDSITLGSPAKAGGWRRLLANMAPNLVMVGRNCTVAPNGYAVGQHEGYGGWYVASHQGGGTIAAVDSYAPELVIIGLGTNDLYYDGLGGYAATLVNQVAFAESVAARASVKRVIYTCIPPIHPSEPQYAASVSYRAAFAAAFAAASSKISTCDPWSGTANPGADFTDVVHPSEAGYAKAAPLIFAAVVAAGIQVRPNGLYGRAAPGWHT